MTERPTIDQTSTVSPRQAAQIQELVRKAAATDGYAALNEAATLALRYDEPATIHLLACCGSELVGYAQVSNTAGNSTGVLVVSPSARRRGVGSALLTQLLENARTPLWIWAMHDTVAAAKLAEKFGLVRARELLIMTRTLAGSPVPAPDIPAQVRIRPFRVGSDESAWLQVNARAFASHPEQGAITRIDLEERMAEPWFDPAGFFLAEADGRVGGFHWTKQHADHRGEVYVLGVDPDAAGGGLGTALLRTGLRHLADMGNTEVQLYVEGDQKRVIGLYADHGFTVTSRDVMYAQPVRDTPEPRLRFKPMDVQEN